MVGVEAMAAGRSRAAAGKLAYSGLRWAAFPLLQVCLQKHPEHVARIMEDEPPAAAASVAAAATEAAAAAPAAPAAPDVVASAAADVQATQQAAAAGAQ